MDSEKNCCVSLLIVALVVLLLGMAFYGGDCSSKKNEITINRPKYNPGPNPYGMINMAPPTRPIGPVSPFAKESWYPTTYTPQPLVPRSSGVANYEGTQSNPFMGGFPGQVEYGLNDPVSFQATPKTTALNKDETRQVWSTII